MCAVMFFFFFQAEDGIRDYKVTGVQTCALPIFAGLFALLGLGVAVVGLFGLLSYSVSLRGREFGIRMAIGARPQDVQRLEIGRASCRERGWVWGGGGAGRQVGEKMRRRGRRAGG